MVGKFFVSCLYTNGLQKFCGDIYFFQFNEISRGVMYSQFNVILFGCGVNIILFDCVRNRMAPCKLPNLNGWTRKTNRSDKNRKITFYFYFILFFHNCE